MKFGNVVKGVGSAMGSVLEVLAEGAVAEQQLNELESLMEEVKSLRRESACNGYRVERRLKEMKEIINEIV